MRRILVLAVECLSLMTMALVPIGSVRPLWAPHGAGSYVVNHNGDLPDLDLTDGLCKTSSNNCTLRAAIEQANGSSPGTTITFSGNMTITPASPLPPLTVGGTVISGLGHNVTLDGAQAVPADVGLHILGSSGNVVARLTIKNWGIGVLVDGTGGSAQDNIVGTDGDGSNDASERNVLLGNAYYGIQITGSQAADNVVAGNRIGSGAEPNQTGAMIDDGAHHNRIGTDGDGLGDTDERNIIIGNDLAIGLVDSSSNVIAGNYIGLDSNGSTAVGNGGGIAMNNADGNLIGTDGDGVADSAERNVIAATTSRAGIDLQDSDSNRIAGNYIGTNSAGTAARGNALGGIEMGPGTTANIIGTNGDGAGDDHEGNVISANGGGGFNRGILLTDADGNTIAGNYIGANAAGTSALGNNGYGINLSMSEFNTIGTDGDGTSDAFEGNLISGNTGSGINIRSSSNTVSGNRIGTDVSGTAPMPNGGMGVNIFSYPPDSSGNMIGGTTADRGNIIAFNEFDGVHIAKGSNAPAVNNPVISNSIFANEDQGIDLSFTGGADGMTPNDPKDQDSGPNDLMNFPALNAVSGTPSNTYLTVEILDGLPITSIRLQFFSSPDCDPDGHGEGKTYLGEMTVATDSAGVVPSQFVSLGTPAPIGAFVTATATRDWTGGALSTSEFSKCVVVERSPLWYLPESFVALISRTMEQMSGRPGWGRSLLGRLLPIVRLAQPAQPMPELFAGPLLPGDPGTGPDPAEEPVEEATPTPTAEPSVAGFSRPVFSTDAFYYGASTCGPNEVDVEIMAPPGPVRSVVIFLRLAEAEGLGRTDWAAKAMTPIGGGTYRHSIHSEDGQVPTGEFSEAMLQVQFVATDAQGKELARTEVLPGVMLLPCAVPPGVPGAIGP